jgi:hypothetical protein
MMLKNNEIERILWSIALPGFGQILNKHFLKGVLFIAAEIIINTKAHLNEVIISSFYGNTELAVKQTQYQWLMFYPCIYMFAIWDAYKNTEGEKPHFSFLPFVISAYMGTIGVIYSSTVKIWGFLLGPIWLPILCILIGMTVGTIIRFILIKTLKLYE